MSDTSVKEYTAEDLITYKLQRSGIYVAKPRFDTDGTDLFGMLRSDSLSGGITFRYCRIQCKYRSIVGSDRNIVQIKKSYVTPDLVVFLYVEDGDIAHTHLFCFLWDDIRANSSPWSKDAHQFTLSIRKGNFKSALRNYLFDSCRADRIKQCIQTSRQVIESTHGFAHLSLPNIKIDAKAKVR
jgi:hypothetical protein